MNAIIFDISLLSRAAAKPVKVTVVPMNKNVANKFVNGENRTLNFRNLIH